MSGSPSATSPSACLRPARWQPRRVAANCAANSTLRPVPRRMAACSCTRPCSQPSREMRPGQPSC